MLDKKVLVLAVWWLVNNAGAEDSLVIDTTEGPVRGYKASDGDYYAFYGIPYAGDVNGANRFKAPPPPSQREDIYEATDRNIKCIQPSASGGVIGVENCLVLNIFTNSTTPRKPTLIWLNGDLYTTDVNENLDFRSFIETNEVLVITLNYRLSIFGFLCLGVEEAPGNAGLKDVVAALTWLRNNIERFGGFAYDTMIVGHGSAGAMVDLINLSPLGIRLFSRAVAQSGSLFSPWAMSYNTTKSAVAVGESLGHTRLTYSALAKVLQTATANDLLTAITDIGLPNDNTAHFAPCIETKYIKDNIEFLVEPPIDILRAGNYRHIPFIYTYTTREGSVRAHQAVHNDWLTKMDSQFEDFIPPDLKLNENNAHDVIERIKQFYFDERQISMDTIEEYLDYHGDTMVILPAIRTAVERSNVLNRMQIRLMEFAYVGSASDDWSYPTIPLNGARHGQELVYLFNSGREIITPNDEYVRNSLVARWYTLAVMGWPFTFSPPGDLFWPGITNTSLGALTYREDDDGFIVETILSESYTERLNFWNEIYELYYVAPPVPVPDAANNKALSIVIVILIGILSIILK